MIRLLSIALGLVVLSTVGGSDLRAAPFTNGPFQNFLDAPEPFQASISMNVTVFEPIYSVPLNRRAEVEFLSIRVIHGPAPPPQAGGVWLRVETTYDGEPVEHTLPLVELTDQHRVASHKVLLHADPGTDVLLQVTGGCAGGNISCNVRATVSGYLYRQ